MKSALLYLLGTLYFLGIAAVPLTAILALANLALKARLLP